MALDQFDREFIYKEWSCNDFSELSTGSYFEEEDEIKEENIEDKVESKAGKENVEVKKDPSDLEEIEIKEEEISSDEEEDMKMEYLEPETLKDLKESEKNQISLCPVGSCTFSLETQKIDKHQQHFKLFHPQLDFSHLRFLTL